jgi:hypothetical protein
MGRALGVACKKEEIFLAVAEDGELVEHAHEKLTAPALLEETERLEGTLSDLERVLREVRPDIVRILRPEQTYEDSYARIAPRATLETLVRLACLDAKVPVEMLHRNSARARLGLPGKGNFEERLAGKVERVGKYWNAGRNLAAAAALAEGG